MPVCPSCGNEVAQVCAADGKCQNCSPCCQADLTRPSVILRGSRASLKQTLLHRDDGLAATKVPGERLADLELKVIEHFVKSQGSLLDLGCGSGRAGLFFATNGFDVVGVDIDSPTLHEARRIAKENGVDIALVQADARRLCFRSESFDYVVSLASTLSEKHRVWLNESERKVSVDEATKVARLNGTILVSFVHRYWSVRGLVSFLKHYMRWAMEKVSGKRTELGDYVEVVGGGPIRFHAFTIREATSLFSKKHCRLEIWKRGTFFTDWFFIIAKKVA